MAAGKLVDPKAKPWDDGRSGGEGGALLLGQRPLVRHEIQRQPVGRDDREVALAPRLVAPETHDEMIAVQFPGLDGVFRLDVGKGLRDGSTAFSFIYEL